MLSALPPGVRVYKSLWERLIPAMRGRFPHQQEVIMPYEVQHTTLFYGWRNTWSYAEADGVLQLETFATAEEAQAALDEFFQDIGQEVAAGQKAPRDRGEYRVRYMPAIPIAE